MENMHIYLLARERKWQRGKRANVCSWWLRLGVPSKGPATQQYSPSKPDLSSYGRSYGVLLTHQRWAVKGWFVSLVSLWCFEQWHKLLLWDKPLCVVLKVTLLCLHLCSTVLKFHLRISSLHTQKTLWWPCSQTKVLYRGRVNKTMIARVSYHNVYHPAYISASSRPEVTMCGRWPRTDSIHISGAMTATNERVLLWNCNSLHTKKRLFGEGIHCFSRWRMP